ERNPGRVPFVFQSSVFETFHGFQKLAQRVEKVFSTRWVRLVKSRTFFALAQGLRRISAVFFLFYL
ncbi:MAG: hypothetical protein RR350_06530, partial [Oscillibacter sp.]